MATYNNPRSEAYSAPQALSGLRSTTSKGRGEKGKGKGRGRKDREENGIKKEGREGEGSEKVKHSFCQFLPTPLQEYVAQRRCWHTEASRTIRNTHVLFQTRQRCIITVRFLIYS